MARKKPTEDDLKEREARAAEFKSFMKSYLFTEIRLAELLNASRRTVQMIKAGRVTPQPGTLRKWIALKQRYEEAKDF
jgi:hypothetical protein